MTETVTIPRSEYEAMLHRLEDLDDILAGYEARGDDTMPLALAQRILNGEHPVKVWRDHRGLSATELCAAAGISKGYLSEIENRRKPGSVEAYKAIAAALKVRLESVVP